MGKETVRCIDTPDFIIKHGINQDKKTRLLFPYMMEALREIEHNDVKISDVGKAAQIFVFFLFSIVFLRRQNEGRFKLADGSIRVNGLHRFGHS